MRFRGRTAFLYHVSSKSGKAPKVARGEKSLTITWLLDGVGGQKTKEKRPSLFHHPPSSELMILLQQHLVWCLPEGEVPSKNYCIVVSGPRSQQRLKVSCLDNFWTTEHFVTTPALVVHHYMLEAFVTAWTLGRCATFMQACIKRTIAITKRDFFLESLPFFGRHQRSKYKSESVILF